MQTPKKLRGSAWRGHIPPAALPNMYTLIAGDNIVETYVLLRQSVCNHMQIRKNIEIKLDIGCINKSCGNLHTIVNCIKA